MRTSLTFFSLLTLGLLTIGCSSTQTPQDMCDCLNKSADAYTAKHPDLTKAELESNGNEVMTELIAPCKEMGEAIEKRLKESDPTAYTKVQGEMQTCLNTLAEKMKAGAKDESLSQADKEAQQEADEDAAQDAAEARADAADVDNDAAGTSDEDWNQLITTYEQYATQYAGLMAKANKGDLSAGAQASELYVKVEELGGQFEEAEGKLTPAQAARFAKVQARVMQAMMKTQN
ncbi:hypothetical protein Q5H93_05760 [Hymenobacter sp. ASUV-10]|uniref:Lipoprotein n=1 Tax=Hymenobacter aranciens TaxID=3063996 RepID=A0ABT9B7I3_9BACT|nr:hypothetical protein [Hymenobacter sp. ASUV-10]MDO7874231.1 hypothetical protein [Hymenobacter sp. ASUV-10]